MDDKATLRWQHRLLPAMVFTILASAIFFAVTSLAEFYWLQQSFPNTPAAATATTQDYAGVVPKTFDQSLRLAQQKALTNLERSVVGLRHEDARIIVWTRLWTRLMGFITGMLVATIGAVFVLGKMQEGQTTVSGSSGQISLAIASSSPGIILSIVGSALIAISILSTTEFDVTDQATYFGAAIGSGTTEVRGAGDTAVQAPSLEDLRKHAPEI